MVEIDTRTCVGRVSGRMEALGRWRLVLGVITLDRGDAGKDFMVEIDTRTCVGQVSGRMEAEVVSSALNDPGTAWSCTRAKAS